MCAKWFMFGLVAAGTILMGFVVPADADVKVLQYNADGSVKGIKGDKKNKAKGALGSAKSKFGKFLPAERFVKRELIVVNPTRHFEANAKPLGFKIVEKIKLSTLKLSVFRLRTPAKFSVIEAKAYLSKKFPRIIVDANHTYDITGSLEPKKKQYPQQAANTAAQKECGQGVRIGMVDGGVKIKHPALTGQKIKYRRFGTKGLKPGPSDHGTSIAGMFVGKLPKQGLGGFLPAAKLIAASVQEVSSTRKVLARASNIVRAIDWLVSEKVHVINFNVAGADNQILSAAIDGAHSMGVIMVAAVGNWGTQKAAAFPAAYAPVIGVTGVDKLEKIYSRANRGEYVDFTAKGVRVWAAGTSKGGQFMSGTSYATPIISSLVAVKVASGVKSSPEVMRGHLKRYAVDIGSTGKDGTFGWGFVDKPILCR